MTGDSIAAVRLSEMYETGKSGDILAEYPNNKGSGVILNKGCKVEAKINGKWDTLWEVRISNNVRYGPEATDPTQLNKDLTLSILIDLMRKYKKFMSASIVDNLKDIYRWKIDGLSIAFDTLAEQGEITPETVNLCSIKETILRETISREEYGH